MGEKTDKKRKRDGEEKTKAEKKERKETKDEQAESTVEPKLNPIAKPLADKKLTKKLFKLTKKAKEAKSIRKGVKEVTKAIRKGQKGLVILAGDVTPLDVMTHIPVLCEEANIPYVYVTSKDELGTVAGTKRATSTIMVSKTPKKPKNPEEKSKDYSEEYNECESDIKELEKKQ
eukprot:GEZU01037870.1.p1 GENE.GEZU01037870.1~~GEZU01037870.1.p1  ORF type:complete len:174 (-),score=66.94 GEZU01037870.1:91-612(-)